MRRPGERGSATYFWLRLAALGAVLAVAALVAWRLGYFHLRHTADLARAVESVRGTPWIGPTFVTLYAAVAALALPVSPLALAAGALLGVPRGSLYVWLGSLFGAAAGYWLARGVAGKLGRRELRGHGDVLRRLRAKSGFLPVLRLQLLPVTPFGLVNAAAAIAGVPFLAFLAATAIGVIPGTVAYVFVGERLFAGITSTERRRALLYAAGVALLIAALTFAPAIARKVRRGRTAAER